MARPRRPLSRNEFEIAIVCALPLEYDAVSLVFDGFWDDEGDTYGKAVRDTNSYTTGWVGRNNVVLALLPSTGKVKAASATAAVRLSYTELKLALLVGICGGVPRKGTGDDDEILLGDVCISNTVIEWDFGRRYPDGFRRRDMAEYDLERPTKDIRILLATLKTELGLDRLQKRASFHLKELQSCYARKRRGTKYKYPGSAEDRLFRPDYQHKHHRSDTMGCTICSTSTNNTRGSICDDAAKESCQQLQCDETQLVQRKRLDIKRQLEQQGDIAMQEPRIHIGRIASGDSAMNSSEDRDRISKVDKVIAFEMSGAGIWDEVPCLVIKGVCDYSDGHNNKIWHSFTAATAASTMKAILERYIWNEQSLQIPATTDLLERTNIRQVHENSSSIQISAQSFSHPLSNQRISTVSDDANSHSHKSYPRPTHFIVPFDRDPGFVGREEIFSDINRLLSWRHRVAIAGLGGVGKSQIAIEYCYRFQRENPQCSVFWVPANTPAQLDEAYRAIGKRLGLPKADEPGVNISDLIFEWLSDHSHGCCLMVLDGIDDINMLSTTPSETSSTSEKHLLSARWPLTSSNGKVLTTTRDTRVGSRLSNGEDCIVVPVLAKEEAERLFLSKLNHQTSSSQNDITILAKELDYLPLAITQATTFMRESHCSTGDYLEALGTSDGLDIELLSHNLPDPRRYPKVLNSVFETWKMSFDLIRKNDPRAAEILCFIAVIDRQGIPKLLLRKDAEAPHKFLTALGTLLSFSFIRIEKNDQLIAVPPLVHMCLQAWLGIEHQKQHYEAEAVDCSVLFMGGMKSRICLLAAFVQCNLIDHLRRQSVLMCGSIMIIFSLSILFYFGSLQIEATSLATLIFVIFFSMAFGATCGPLSQFSPDETLPLNIRDRRVELSTAVGWICSSVSAGIISIFLSAAEWRQCLIYASFCVISFVFVYVFYGETSVIRLKDTDPISQHHTRSMNIPVSKPEQSLHTSLGSPTPSLDIRPGSDSAIPDLDLDPPLISLPDTPTAQTAASSESDYVNGLMADLLSELDERDAVGIGPEISI